MDMRKKGLQLILNELERNKSMKQQGNEYGKYEYHRV